MCDFVLTKKQKKIVHPNSPNIYSLHHHKTLFQIVNLVYDIVLKYNFVLPQPLNKNSQEIYYNIFLLFLLLT